MDPEPNPDVVKLQKEKAELIDLLREIKTALLASGWRHDYIAAKVDEALKRHAS